MERLCLGPAETISQLNKPSSLTGRVLPAPWQLGASTMNFLCIINVFFVLGESKLPTVFYTHPNEHCGEKDNLFPWSPSLASPSTAQDNVHFSAAGLGISPYPSGSPESLHMKCSPDRQIPVCITAKGTSFPGARCGTCWMRLIYLFIEFLGSLFVSLPRCLSMTDCTLQFGIISKPENKPSVPAFKR